MRTLIVTLVVLVLAAPAEASFPGANGDLVVSVDDGSCELGSNLYRVPPTGGDLAQITDVCTSEGDDGRARYAGAPEAAPNGTFLLAYSNVVPSGVITLATDGSAVTEVPVSPAIPYDPTSTVSQLSFFPSGDTFLAGRRRYALDGASVPAAGDNGRVSPDGRLIAAQRSGRHPGLWLYSVRTRKPVRRIATRGVEPDWSPDGRRLVYRTGYQQREVEGGASGGNLFVVSRFGRHKRTLVHREDIAETQPTWSPDGKTVAWVSLGFSAGDVGFRVSPSLWRVSVRTGRRTQVATLPQPFVEEGYFHSPELTWLPKP